MISMHHLGDLMLHSWDVTGMVPTGSSEGDEGGVTVQISPGIDS